MKESSFIKSIQTPEQLTQQPERAKRTDREEEFPEDVAQKAQEIVETVRERHKVIGQGSRADVFNDIPNPFWKDSYAYEQGYENNHHYLCVKMNRRSTTTSEYQSNLEDEARLQVIAQKILRSQETAERPMAHVPEVMLDIRTMDGEEFLVMERVAGKTLWRLKMEAALDSQPAMLAAVQKELANHNPTVAYTSTDIIDTQLENAIIAAKGSVNAAVSWIDEYGKQVPFLSEGQFNRIQNSVIALNEAGFYHRDLHLKNIMLDRHGDVFFIDFATAYIHDNRYEIGKYMGDEANQDRATIQSCGELVIWSEDTRQKMQAAEGRKRESRSEAVLQKFGIPATITAEKLNELLQKKPSPLRRYLTNLTLMGNFDTVYDIIFALSEIEKEGNGSSTQYTSQLVDDMRLNLQGAAQQQKFDKAVAQKLTLGGV